MTLKKSDLSPNKLAVYHRTLTKILKMTAENNPDQTVFEDKKLGIFLIREAVKKALK